MVSKRRQNKARKRAQDDDAAIHKLSDEILLNLFELLNTTSKSTILAATRVCSRWHALAQRIIDNVIGPLTIGKKTERPNLELFRRLKKDAAFRRRVHHLSVGDWHLSGLAFDTSSPYRPGGYFTEDWSEAARYADQTWPQIEGLIQVLPKLSLALFTWQALPFMPQPLAKALKGNARRISILRNEPYLTYAQLFYDAYINPIGLQSLQIVASSLASLELLIPAVDAKLLARLGSLISVSRPLQTLRVYAVSRIRSTRYLPNSIERTPHAKFSTVSAMHWLGSGHGWTAQGSHSSLRLFSLGLTNFCVCAQSEAQGKWIEMIEWRNMRALEITCLGILRLVHDRLGGLTSLTLTLTSPTRQCEHPMCSTTCEPGELATLLKAIPSLTHLEITNGTNGLAQILDILPSKLRSLSSHEVTPAAWPSPTRPLLDATILEYVGTNFPYLEEFACDVPYSDVEYHRYLDLVGRHLHKLHTLTVYREVEQYGTDREDPPRSAVTILSVEEDFKRVRSAVSDLGKLEVRIESSAPFDRDIDTNEHGFDAYFAAQRRLVAVTDGRRPCVRCVEVDQAAAVVSGSGLDFFQGRLDTFKELADEGPNFYLKEPQVL